MDASQQMLLYCQTGVYDCSGTLPSWGWWAIGTVATLTIIGLITLIYWALHE